MPTRCFVISPIGNDGSPERRHADMVLGVAVEPLFRARGYLVERSDRHADAGQITTAIFAALRDADVCVADLSFLNANVLYELGVRHTLMRPVIQIARQGTVLPFDTANQRTLFFDPADYGSLSTLSAKIGEQLDRIEADEGPVSNPLTHAIGSFDVKAQGDGIGQLVADLQARMDTLESRPMSHAETAAGIFGQGEMATRSMADVRFAWRRDLEAAALDWAFHSDGSQTTTFRGFDVAIHPQRGGRWSADAREASSGYSVPWPSWQPSELDAKATIIALVNGTLNEREGNA